MTSPDGITWTSRLTLSLNRNWESVTYGNKLFVAVARSQGTGDISFNNRTMTSVDGFTWINSGSPSNNAWNSVTFGNGSFVAVASSGTNNRVMTTATVPPTITNFTIPTKIFGDVPFTITEPTSNSSGSFNYTSSNTSVATISGNIITIIGAGTSTIVATQSATVGYTSGQLQLHFK